MAKAAYRDYIRMVRGFNTFTNLMQCDCINGYAVGKKRKEGGKTNQTSIVVFVNKKLGLRRLPISNRIPKVFRVPSERSKDGFLEFATDVQTARFSSLQYTDRHRPAPSGISIGHVNITAGTLGGLVKDQSSGNVAILSNNHVLADSNEAVNGDAILQPGPADDGNPASDQIATLTRFVGINFDGGDNRVDGAIASPDDPDDVLWSTLDVGPETPRIRRIVAESDLGTAVQKTGRTTGHTYGFIDALFATVQVKYDMFKKATFVDQIIVSQNPGEEDFSNGGDSGSLVYDLNNSVVGLLFAGSESSEEEPGTTIINPINFVMNALDIGFLSADDAQASSTARGSAKHKTRKKSSKSKKKSKTGGRKAR